MEYLAGQYDVLVIGAGHAGIEAALAAKGRAPGIRRDFAAMQWAWLPAGVWPQAREEARAREFHGEYHIFASDIDPRAVAMARDNARRAGVDDCITFAVADAREFDRTTDRGVIVTNPPYGERLMEKREAEQLYGRKLTTPEMNMLLGLRDYLGLPADVLMELIHYVFQEYRAERGHAGTPTMRRIEKEAYAWADQEIHTTAQAEEYLQRRQARRELAQQVLQVLQIQDRAPSRTERGYITSWLDMGFGCDAIAEAYDRTVVATGARKWAYLNRILMSWHEKGLHTPEEIETGDPRAAGKRRAANPAAPAAERDDLDRVEQLLRKMEQTNT